MKKSSSVKSNFIYQVLYSVVTMVIPLVVTPFLTRSLLESEMGRFTYTRSIASYFLIFSMMGIVKYGQRVISQSADNEEQLRKSFWSLFYTHVIFSIISLLSYLVIVYFFFDSYKKLLWIQGIYIASGLFDITWLYYGLENFKGVVCRNAVIKIIEAILYITLIESPQDIYLYAFINCSVFLISQIILIPGVIKEIKPIHVVWKECLEHVKPLMFFAVAVIGISLYTVFDTTLLGIFSTVENVAFYEYSNRIAKIPLTIASIIGTVMFPRACKLVAQNNIKEQKQYMYYSIIIVSIVGSVAFWGLLAVGRPLAEIYLGDNFGNCGPIIAALSPLVYIIGIGDVVRTQYMIPNKMDKEYVFSILLNAITNLIISNILIIGFPRNMQIYGAVIGTVAAEFVGMIYQIILCRNVLSIRKLIKTILVTFTMGAIMFIVLEIVANKIYWNILTLSMMIVLGAMIFMPLAITYIFIFEKDFKNIIFKQKKA